MEVWNMDIEILKEHFSSLFKKKENLRAYMAPGRVNLIGEHIDYNGGHVFPCALDVGNYAIVCDRKDDVLSFYSENFPECGIINASLSDLKYDKKDGWTNYAKGVFKAFQKKGYSLSHGFDILVSGNIPGSGLSSSAAMEVLMANIIKDAFSLDVNGVEIALLSQEAENDFCGLNCGIMDQFASANGKKDCALFLDCKTLDYSYVPLILKGYKIIVTNSNKPHSLVTSHYNDRRRECEEALKDLQKECRIDNLCQLSVEEFEKHAHLISSPVNEKRARFAVYEEERTKKAVDALKKMDLATFGRLINESGDGLKDLYEATCDEIDFLVAEARRQDGCIGSRETGGGWGGNTISIVKEEKVDSFIMNLEKAYYEKTSLHAECHILSVGEGGRKL